MAFKRSAVRSRLSPPNETEDEVPGLFVLRSRVENEPLTSCNVIPGQRQRRGGREASYAAGGSIPLISTKRKTEDKVPGLFYYAAG